jgi:uncharacterized membrane protein
VKQRLKHHWNRTPHTVRKPVVLIVGLLIVIASGLVGWLPGPGGIPLFLVGIAVLASEFTWAERIKKLTLDIVHYLGRQYRAHRVLGTILFILITGASLVWTYFAVQKWLHQ